MSVVMLRQRAFPAAAREERGTGFALLVVLLAVIGLRADEAVAEPLGASAFSEGLRLLDAGKHDEACAQFRASMSQSPSVGALLNVAKCSARENRLAAAQEEYRALLVLNEGTTDPERRKNVELAVREAMRALLPRVPTLELSIVPTPEVLEVELDGKPFERTRLGSPHALDPGEHTIKIIARGFLPVTETLTVRESEKLETVLRLTPSDPNDRPADLSIPGWVLGGAGVVGLGAFATLLGLSGARASEIEELCGEGARPPVCDPASNASRANNLSAEGERLQIGGWISLALGVALVGTGAGFILSSLGDGPEVSAELTSPGDGPGWTLRVRF